MKAGLNMKIELNRHSTISLVKQISESISDRIRSGHYDSNIQLPSIRELAKKLEVSMVTVSKAYTVLEDEGLITRVKGKGTFVSKGLRRKWPLSQFKEKTYDWQHNISDYLPRNLYHQYQKHSDRYEFSASKIEPKLLPNHYLEQEVRLVLKDNSALLSKYAEVEGDYELRFEIASYLRNLGMAITGEEILITNGVQQGIDLVARTFLGPGDIVVSEAPTYSAAIDVFRSYGATVLSIPIDNDGMNVKQLEQLYQTHNPKVIYTNPSFQNPTGTVLSKKRREKLIDIAQEHGTIVIEDDSWSEIYFNEPPPPPIKSFDENGNVIYIKGFSKILSPGCRIAAIAADSSFFNRLVASKSVADLGSPLITQKIILPLLRSQRMKQHIQKLRIALSLKRDIIVGVLNQYAPKGISWEIPEGGLNIWLSCPIWFDSDPFFSKAHEKDIHILPGSVCYPGEPEYNHFKVCFAYLNNEKLRDGVILLCRLLDVSLKNQNSL